jgi:hypothetical protein
MRIGAVSVGTVTMPRSAREASVRLSGTGRRAASEF